MILYDRFANNCGGATALMITAGFSPAGSE